MVRGERGEEDDEDEDEDEEFFFEIIFILK